MNVTPERPALADPVTPGGGVPSGAPPPPQHARPCDHCSRVRSASLAWSPQQLSAWRSPVRPWRPGGPRPPVPSASGPRPPCALWRPHPQPSSSAVTPVLQVLPGRCTLPPQPFRGSSPASPSLRLPPTQGRRACPSAARPIAATTHLSVPLTTGLAVATRSPCTRPALSWSTDLPPPDPKGSVQSSPTLHQRHLILPVTWWARAWALDGPSTMTVSKP